MLVCLITKFFHIVPSVMFSCETNSIGAFWTIWMSLQACWRNSACSACLSWRIGSRSKTENWELSFWMSMWLIIKVARCFNFYLTIVGLVLCQKTYLQSHCWQSTAIDSKSDESARALPVRLVRDRKYYANSPLRWAAEAVVCKQLGSGIKLIIWCRKQKIISEIPDKHSNNPSKQR